MENSILTSLVGPLPLYSIANDFKLVELSRSGITGSDLFLIVDKSKFSREDWAKWMGISLSEYQYKRAVLPSHLSERVLEIARLLHYAEEVLGNTETVVQWFNHSSIPLGNITPKSLLDNTFGIDIVHNELGRIEQGVLA